jgi:hypothetical protein
MHDQEYPRLQAVFLAMANQPDQLPVKGRWLALAQACKDTLISKTRAKPDPAYFGVRWRRAA